METKLNIELWFWQYIWSFHHINSFEFAVFLWILPFNSHNKFLVNVRKIFLISKNLLTALKLSMKKFSLKRTNFYVEPLMIHLFVLSIYFYPFLMLINYVECAFQSTTTQLNYKMKTKTSNFTYSHQVSG